MKNLHRLQNVFSLAEEAAENEAHRLQAIETVKKLKEQYPVGTQSWVNALKRLQEILLEMELRGGDVEEAIRKMTKAVIELMLDEEL